MADMAVDKEGPSRATKRPSDAESDKDGKGWKILKKMGYKEGAGLGASQQGIKDPIQVDSKSSRLGLGAVLIQPSAELLENEIEIEEVPTFFPPCETGIPQADQLKNGITTDKMPTVIDNETEFCSADVLTAMVKAKDVFNTMDDRQLRNARARANPFESIRGAIFQNRAAMKMANLDAVFRMQLTQPTDPEGRPLDLANPEDEQLFYFADVCAGPGGFTEYVLWKHQWKARGFGMTLRGRDDFRLDKFTAASPYTFETFYGAKNTGDITDKENLISFKKVVMAGTNGAGVNLFMADGGFSVEGRENIQEILSKRLYLCQSLCALITLRRGGNFVCKLFDTFTPFTVGLLNLLWRCFDKMALHKPHTSRPANSERYLVCLGFKGNCDPVVDHLFHANSSFGKCLSKRSAANDCQRDDVITLLPSAVLLADTSFCDHVKMRNEQLALRQTKYLKLYEEFAKNPMYADDRQDDFRKKCLQYWGIPDLPRPSHPWTKRTSVDNFLARHKLTEIRSNPQPKALTLDDLKKLDSSQHYVQFICNVNEQIDSEIRWMVASVRNETLCLEAAFWSRVNEQNYLVENSLILANVTNRRLCEARNRRGRTTIRILDILLLNGTSLTHLPLASRLQVARNYCRAVEKVRDESKCCLHVAELWEADKAAQYLQSVPSCTIKVHNCIKLKLCETLAESYFYACDKFLLIPKDICGPAVGSSGQQPDGDDEKTKKLNLPHGASCIVAMPTGISVSSDEIKAFCCTVASAMCPPNNN